MADSRKDTLLWAWDHRFWRYLASRDPVAVACALQKRLRTRAFAERARGYILAAAGRALASRLHHHRADLYEAAALGWTKFVDRLIRLRSQAA